MEKKNSKTNIRETQQIDNRPANRGRGHNDVKESTARHDLILETETEQKAQEKKRTEQRKAKEKKTSIRPRSTIQKEKKRGRDHLGLC